MKREWLYPKTYEEAKNAQKEMAELVSLRDSFSSFSTIAGVDVSNIPFDPEERIFAAAVLFSHPGFELLETMVRAERQEFPYIPGLLGFREAPALVEAVSSLSTRPDLILVDGHGISHPRGLGIASHIGVLLDIPTIGVAKSILVGKSNEPLVDEVGSTTPLLYKGKEVGRLLRSKKRCNPLIISSGHKVSLDTAVAIVKEYLTTYRLPEPTRHAHLAANAYRVSCLSQRKVTSLV